METQEIEYNHLIAERQKPGDRWVLVDGDDTIYPSLTEALEAYFQTTSEPCHFRLEPLNGKLFAIKNEIEEIVVQPPKKYNIYGDF